MRKNRFLDVIPDSQSASVTQLQQVDRTVTGTVSEILDDGLVAVAIDGSTEPDVVVPSASGITAVGASVRVSRDSSGRAVEASIPDYIPYGAPVMAVGVTGEWLAQLDATAASTSAGLEAAQATADKAAADALASLEAASKAVTDTLDEYALGGSETVPPTTGWSTTPPVRTPGTFIWVRTTVTYGTGESTTASPVLLTGNTGAQGQQGTPGQDGQPGADGVGVTSTVVTYAGSTSATTPPTSGWTSQVPTVPKGHYLWTRTVWTYTTGATETGYSVAYMPEDGNDGENGIAGKDGVGITGTVIVYAVSSSGTAAPSSGWQSTPPSATAGQFMWTRTTWTYSDASTEVGYSVGKIGETGATGAAGKGIASTTVTYQASASGTTAPTGTWTSSIPSVAANQYLWTRTVISYTDGTSTTGYSIGKMGATGADGAAGADGRGVQSTAVTYQASSSGTTVPTGSWSSSIPTVSAGQYLWTRTVITYTDATTSTSYAIGKMGEQGVKGDTGSTGATGTSVTSVTTYYRTVTKGGAAPAKPTASPAPSPWATTEPAYADNTELYRTDRVVYSTGAFAYTDVSKVSAYTAAAQAITVANLVEAAAQGLVKASATDPGHYKGRIWLQLDASGRMIGIKVSNGTAWSSYALMADQLIVPGSLGTVSIANGAITAPKIYATSELWAKILNVAGDATIGGNLLAQNIVGKTLLGAYIEGCEILMRGQAGTPTTLFSDNFTTTTTQALSSVRIKETWGAATARNGWCAEASVLANPGTTASGRTGNALLLPSATWDSDRDGWFAAVQTGAMGSPSSSGDKTLSLWLKPIVVSTAGGYAAPSTATVTATAYITNGTTTSTVTVTAQATFGSWTQVSIPIPSGWTLVTPALPNTHTMRVTIRPDSDPTGSQEMTWQVAIDDVAITRSADVNSNVHIYRNTSGAPTIDISDINAKIRVRLTAPIGGGASLSFFDTSGNAVILDDTGVTQAIYQAQAETTPWSQILSGPAAGKREGSGSTSATRGSWTTYAMASSTDTVAGDIAVSGSGLTVGRDGLYDVTAVVRFSPSTSGRRGIQVTINNVEQTLTQRFLAPASNNTMPVAVSDKIKLTKGDIVRVQGFQDAGTLSMTGGGLALSLVAPL